MSVEEFFDPAVDPAFNVVGCPRYLRVADKGEEIGQTVLDKTPDGPELLVRVPPSPLLVLQITVAPFRQKVVVRSTPALPAADPASFLSTGSNRWQFLDEFAESLAGGCFWMEREFGKGLPEDMDQAPLEWHRRPTPSYCSKEPALAIADDRCRPWQP